MTSFFEFYCAGLLLFSYSLHYVSQTYVINDKGWAKMALRVLFMIQISVEAFELIERLGELKQFIGEDGNWQWAEHKGENYTDHLLSYSNPFYGTMNALYSWAFWFRVGSWLPVLCWGELV